MKKIFSLVLCISMILGCVTISHAKTGDVLGYAKYTDISAYINHYPITSYNINDYTAVVAEDLKNYGFNVVWNGSERSLSITRNTAATKITPSGTVYKYSSKAGQNSFAYLETDIVTYVNGKKVESFNIDGKTCVYIDSLEAFGEVSWVPETRAIKLWIDTLPFNTYAPIPEYNAVSTPSPSSFYYTGTTIPDYTAVTGVELEDIFITDDGGEIYIYPDTNIGKYSEVVDYMGFLESIGWTEYDSTEDQNSITWFYTKGSDLISISFNAKYDQIYIIFK